jgi:5-methylcytosine-specific restriction endonuclease McrA
MDRDPNDRGREPYEFKDDVRDQAYARQEQYCAGCAGGKKLQKKGSIGHHVIPVQVLKHTRAPEGVFSDAEAFIRSVDNCVMLCQQCHFRFHAAGNTRYGPVAVPEEFKFSHGLTRTDLRGDWVKGVEKMWGLLFPAYKSS